MRAWRERSFVAALVDRAAGDADRAELLNQLRGLAGNPGVVFLETVESASASGTARGERYAAWSAPEKILALLREMLATRKDSPADGAARDSSRDPGAAPSSRRGPAPSERPRAILVVDDSVTFRSSLGDHLRRVGHDVMLAASGKQALGQVARNTPDAIVLDLVMPEMDGLETCRQIRILESKLPILMLTASDEIRARMDTRAAGANEFLVKGNDFDAVVAGVLDFIRRAAADHRPRSPSQGGSEQSGPPLLAQVVAASGLSPVIAEAAIARACRRAGIDAQTMTQSDLERALPNIQRSLRTFLPPDAHASRLEALEALVERAPGRISGGR